MSGEIVNRPLQLVFFASLYKLSKPFYCSKQIKKTKAIGCRKRKKGW